MKMIDSYFKLEILSKEVQQLNKINCQTRFDCTLYNGDYPGIEPFKNKKGMFFLYQIPSKKVIKADKRRTAKFMLQNNRINFTSLYNQSNENKYYGYANEDLKLKNGNINPTLPFKDDIYLFKVNKEFRIIELFIVKNQKGLISNIYQMFVDGEFDEEIKSLVDQSKPFYNYENK